MQQQPVGSCVDPCPEEQAAESIRSLTLTLTDLTVLMVFFPSRTLSALAIVARGKPVLVVRVRLQIPVVDLRQHLHGR